MLAGSATRVKNAGIIYFNIYRFSHNRLSDDDIRRFVEQNEEFLTDLYRNYGKTNMDDYYFQYIKVKKNKNEQEWMDSLKIPSNAMIPSNMNQVNVNNMSNPIISPMGKQEYQPQQMNPMIRPQQNIRPQPNQPMNYQGNQQMNKPMMPFNNPMLMNLVRMRPQLLQNMQNMQNPQQVMPNFNMLDPNNPMTKNYMQFLRNPQLMQRMPNMQNIQNMFNQNMQQPMPNQTQGNINTSNENVPVTPPKVENKNLNISSFLTKINPFDKPNNVTNDNVQPKEQESERYFGMGSQSDEDGNLYK